MSNEYENLRETIRKILEQQKSLSEERVEDEREVLDWILFEAFGERILMSLGFKGIADDVLQPIKKEFEEEGWVFDE